MVLRKWPSVFREGIKITNDYLGILEISMHGKVEITSKDLEKMKKFGFIHDRTNVYPLIPKDLDESLHFQNEDDLSDFIVTSVTFREHQAPQLENDGESDRQVIDMQSKFEHK